MRLKISHTTDYQLTEPTKYGLQQLRITPTTNALQTVKEWRVEMIGGKLETHYTDEHGALVHLASIEPEKTDLKIFAEGEVETIDASGVFGKQIGFMPVWLYQHSTPLTRIGQGIRALVRSLDLTDKDDISRLHELCAAILRDIPYETGRTNVETSAEDAILEGAGVCQDHAHIFIAAARHMGFPARYVSGYLMMNDREMQDAGHAWAEAYVEGLGLVGFDVSNEICPDDRYVRLAVGLDYSEAAPVSGMTWGQGGASMKVMVQVQQQQ